MDVPKLARELKLKLDPTDEYLEQLEIDKVHELLSKFKLRQAPILNLLDRVPLTEHCIAYYKQRGILLTPISHAAYKITFPESSESSRDASPARVFGDSDSE